MLSGQTSEPLPSLSNLRCLRWGVNVLEWGGRTRSLEEDGEEDIAEEGTTSKVKKRRGGRCSEDGHVYIKWNKIKIKWSGQGEKEG